MVALPRRRRERHVGCSPPLQPSAGRWRGATRSWPGGIDLLLTPSSGAPLGLADFSSSISLSLAAAVHEARWPGSRLPFPPDASALRTSRGEMGPETKGVATSRAGR
ncbi:hypothetical protein MRX96_026972 [Rhipicephalus microplus]